MLEKLNIKAENAMVLWEPRGRRSSAAADERSIVVVDHRDDNRGLLLLPLSMGACCNGWREADPVKRAAHLLALFAIVVGRDGVPGDEAHREFMKIEEYREWTDERTGPFADAYAAWSEAA